MVFYNVCSFWHSPVKPPFAWLLLRLTLLHNSWFCFYKKQKTPIISFSLQVLYSNNADCSHSRVFPAYCYRAPLWRQLLCACALRCSHSLSFHQFMGVSCMAVTGQLAPLMSCLLALLRSSVFMFYLERRAVKLSLQGDKMTGRDDRVS